MNKRKIKAYTFTALAFSSLTLSGCNKLVAEAGYNTLLGMGMAFTILILISLIISLFPLMFGGGKAKKSSRDEVRLQAMDRTISNIEKLEGIIREGKDKDTAAEDEELIAVITAAIAAYESDISIQTAGTAGCVQVSGRRRQVQVPAGYQGFYVRSVRKIGQDNWRKS